MKRSGDSNGRMPLGLIILIDVLLIGVGLVVFALFDHVIPREYQKVVYARAVQTAADSGDFSLKFADKFTDGEIIKTENSYQSKYLNVTLTRYETVLSEFEPKRDPLPLVYFVEDVYIRSIDCLRTVFAKDTFGKGVKEPVVDMAKRVGSVAAVNGDYYGCVDEGLVIRNGQLYREGFAHAAEVMVIYRDGSAEVFESEQEMDIDRIMSDGAWQGFDFGPGFLDENGKVCNDNRINHQGGHPRTIFGMIEPGHYLLITVDGRRDDYSAGMHLDGCANLCKKLGCVLAFNLDGGETAQMTFMGEMVNDPYEDGRDTSDLLYFVDLTEEDAAGDAPSVEESEDAAEAPTNTQNAGEGADTQA